MVPVALDGPSGFMLVSLVNCPLYIAAPAFGAPVAAASAFGAKKGGAFPLMAPLYPSVRLCVSLESETVREAYLLPDAKEMSTPLPPQYKQWICALKSNHLPMVGGRARELLGQLKYCAHAPKGVGCVGGGAGDKAQRFSTRDTKCDVQTQSSDGHRFFSAVILRRSLKKWLVDRAQRSSNRSNISGPN